LGGTTSDYIASFDITATNEAMEIIDFTLHITGA
jgi:hypothetical protein